MNVVAKGVDSCPTGNRLPFDPVQYHAPAFANEPREVPNGRGAAEPRRPDRPMTADELLPLMYSELRRVAAHKMAREAPTQTSQPTDLVHEAWLRLVGTENPVFQNRAHFFASAAEAMRRILIDRARRRQAVRHGGGQERVDMEEVEKVSAGDDYQLLAVNEALDKFAGEFPDQAQLVKLRYFAGMTNDEAAQALAIPARKAKYHWRLARAWLFAEMSGGAGSTEPAPPPF